MSKEKTKYVVGYLGNNYDVYGKEEQDIYAVQPLTSLREAKKLLATMGMPEKATIYKLVEVP